MGKPQEDTTPVVAGPPPSDSASSCWENATCRRTLSVILGVHLLVFAALSIHFHGRTVSNSQATTSAPSKPQIEASFRLRRPFSLVKASLTQLQLDLQDEIGLPNTQIHNVSVFPLSSQNWTEVHFSVSPDLSNDSIAPADLSLLKETFVELFMERSVNLTLSDLFGKVSHFEVLRFPGGITVIPSQPGFPLSTVLVLFNFTLHNSLSHLECNFAVFRKQLANGIILKADESLFVQITNLEGSTLKSPLIVQTSILPVVGLLLPPPRLKQLAQEIVSLPRRNLGLNHTLFGRVKGIELSSYLRHSLRPAQGPSSCPSPSPSYVHELPRRSHKGAAARGFRGHMQHPPAAAPSHLGLHHRARAPASEGTAAAPDHDHDHHHHRYDHDHDRHPHDKSAQDLAPSPSASHTSPAMPGFLPPSPSPNFVSPVHSSTRSGPSKHPSQSIPPAAAPYPHKTHPLVKAPSKSFSLSKGPSQDPHGFVPASSSTPSQNPESITHVPAVFQPSSASVPRFSLLVMIAWLVVLFEMW